MTVIFSITDDEGIADFDEPDFTWEHSAFVPRLGDCVMNIKSCYSVIGVVALDQYTVGIHIEDITDEGISSPASNPS